VSLGTLVSAVAIAVTTAAAAAAAPLGGYFVGLWRAAVLSAVSGLQVKAGLSHDAVIGLTCAILVALFLVQSNGTQRIGVVFAPVILLWYLSNVLVAIYNISAYEGAAIFRAMSPHYIGALGDAPLLPCCQAAMLLLSFESHCCCGVPAQRTNHMACSVH
jgi:K+ transporter